MLSALAVGSDQIGADEALKLGARQQEVEVRLEAVLPFAKEHYPGPPGQRTDEFRESEALELERLAAQAKQVVRLDGAYKPFDRARAGGADPDKSKLQSAAFGLLLRHIYGNDHPKTPIC